MSGPGKDEWGDMDPGHSPGKISRSDYSPYVVGDKMGLNSGPNFSEVVLKAWGKGSEEQNPDVIQAAAMRKLTAAQDAKKNEQKYATPYGAKKVPNGPGF